MSLVAFVLNRTLLRDPRRFARRCRAAAEERGWEPWFAPTPDKAVLDKAAVDKAARDAAARDAAARAAAEIPVLTRQAVAAGAALVVAAGGDGTVRACAEGLAGTGVPLAVVPLGTANLIARALGVPGRTGRALEVAFGGRDRPIDLGRVITGGGGIVFAAMAGIGLDAAAVGAARPYVKRRLGWVAYALAGASRLGWPASDFTIGIDAGAPLRRRARCVVVANAGLLPGGFTLLPTARLDDGRLDVGILAPSGGWDWLRLAGRVLAPGRLPGHAPLECGQGQRVQVSADRVLPRQADGEILAPARTLSVSACPGALVLRLPS